MQDLKAKALEFLYRWVSENKIPQIKKGMVEDLEALIDNQLAEAEYSKTASRMQAASEGLKNEENSQS
jgi:hypothetical protein